MNKKLLKTLQDKCKDFGLTEKAIEELAQSASEGLTDESSDEDIAKVFLGPVIVHRDSDSDIAQPAARWMMVAAESAKTPEWPDQIELIGPQ